MRSTAPLLLLASMLPMTSADGQVLDAQVDLTPRFAEILTAGKDKPTLLQVMSDGLTFRASVRRAATNNASDLQNAENTPVVLFVALISRERVVAKALTKPFQLDVKSAATLTGMLGSSVLVGDQLRNVAPLRPAEFIVTSYIRATESLSAAAVVADPLAALQSASYDKRAGDAVLVALVPADPTLRQKSRTNPLFQVVRPTVE